MIERWNPKERLGRFLGTESDEGELRDLVLRRNAQVMFGSGILITLVQVLMLGDALAGNAHARAGQLASYALMLVVGILACVLSRAYTQGTAFRDNGRLFLRALIVYIVLCIVYGAYNALVTQEILTFVLLMTGGACLFIMPPVASSLLMMCSYIVFDLIYVHPAGLPRTSVFAYWLSWLVITTVSILRYEEGMSAARNEVELRIISMRDELTRVKNRRALRDDFEKWVQAGEVVAIMCDVDDFKNINDKLGHEAGDDVLFALAESLSRVFGRESCYRYGGDEFLCIVPADNVGEQISRVRRRVASIEAGPDRQEVRVTLSMGYVVGDPASDEDLRTMIRLADKCLYKVKKGGKDASLGTVLS